MEGAGDLRESEDLRKVQVLRKQHAAAFSGPSEHLGVRRLKGANARPMDSFNLAPEERFNPSRG